jgi:hypothetical protein
MLTLRVAPALTGTLNYSQILELVLTVTLAAMLPAAPRRLLIAALGQMEWLLVRILKPLVVLYAWNLTDAHLIGANAATGNGELIVSINRAEVTH